MAALAAALVVVAARTLRRWCSRCHRLVPRSRWSNGNFLSARLPDPSSPAPLDPLTTTSPRELIVASRPWLAAFYSRSIDWPAEQARNPICSSRHHGRPDNSPFFVCHRPSSAILTSFILSHHHGQNAALMRAPSPSSRTPVPNPARLRNTKHARLVAASQRTARGLTHAPSHLSPPRHYRASQPDTFTPPSSPAALVSLSINHPVGTASPLQILVRSDNR